MIHAGLVAVNYTGIAGTLLTHLVKNIHGHVQT